MPELGARSRYCRRLSARVRKPQAEVGKFLTQPRSLYVHAPFCARRCSYCDFAVEVMREPPLEEWLAVVARELALTATRQDWILPLRLDTLYVGGGTPSLLGPSAMARLTDAIAPWAVLEPGAEWTAEVNPESFDEVLGTRWRAAGVNRLSMGVQSFDPDVLRWMGRLHGPEGPALAVQAARAAGFENLSVDLIFGLPERLNRDWEADIDRALTIEPQHVSLYGLTAEPGAPLGRWVGEGREQLADEDAYADEYLVANRVLTSAGFDHYEVSNFGRPGLRSRHNAVYWSGQPYAALGPGAHAFYPPFRRWNLKSWSAYRDALRAGVLPLSDQEEVTAEERELERIWLGLRTGAGLVIARGDRLGRQVVDNWEERGLAEAAGDLVRLTPSGWLLLDSLALELYEAGCQIPRARPFDGRATLVQIANQKAIGK
ncbi:MAG: radical SAM family heme chaperone HemW [Gemmatimonas sp.]|nr:radical SAM family heme chaperone HemW [Gemmatimonas sp.]